MLALLPCGGWPQELRAAVQATLRARGRQSKPTRLGAGMGLRVSLVTPFAWSQPHDVNEHVAGLAQELRARGHSVTVLAPSNRARDLAAGRRALMDGVDAELVALGPAVPISRRSRMGVPVGIRASLAIALSAGRFDVVHGFEPGLPSLSYLALRDSGAFTVATFFSPERLGYPPGRAQRERLLGRLDALLATREETVEAAAERFPGRYELVPLGVDLERYAPAEKAKVAVLEWRQTERPLLRALVRELRTLPDWELVLLRTRPLSGRPPLPHDPARTRACAHGVRRRQPRRPLPARRRLRPRARRRRTRRARGAGRGRRDRRTARPSSPARARRRRGCAPARGRRLPGRPRPGGPGGRAEPELRRARRPGRGGVRGGQAPPARRGQAPAARGPRLDRRRPAHAHELVARLLDRRRRVARPRGGGRARRDRRHRPQRLRRRARGGREGAGTAADRHSRRGDQDRRARAR